MSVNCQVKRGEVSTVQNLQTTADPLVVSLPDHEHILGIEDNG